MFNHNTAIINKTLYKTRFKIPNQRNNKRSSKLFAAYFEKKRKMYTKWFLTQAGIISTPYKHKVISADLPFNKNKEMKDHF